MDPDSSIPDLDPLPDFDPTLLIAILACTLLLIVSGMISGTGAAVFSFESSDRQKLESRNRKSGRRILSLLEAPHLLAISLSIWNAVILWTLLALFVFYFDGVLRSTTALGSYYPWIIAAVVALIYMLAILVPRTISASNRMAFAGISVWIIYPLHRILLPLHRYTDSIRKYLESFKKSNQLSLGELEQALEMNGGENPSEEQKMLRGIVRFGTTTVKQIMKPRTDVLSFDIDEDYPTVVEKLLERGYSRIPVYRDNLDSIVGLLYTKDLLPHIDAPADFKWNTLLRAAFFVPGSKKIDDMLKEFQARKTHLAIVVDEFGGTAGIVTLEDVIEEIVGDISDEFDVEELEYSKLDDYNYVVDGKTQISDFCKILEINDEPFNEIKGEYDSLAGLMLQIAGHFPKKGEQMTFKNYTFTVEAVDQRRIVRIKVTITPENSESHA